MTLSMKKLKLRSPNIRRTMQVDLSLLTIVSVKISPSADDCTFIRRCSILIIFG